MLWERRVAWRSEASGPCCCCHSPSSQKTPKSPRTLGILRGQQGHRGTLAPDSAVRRRAHTTYQANPHPNHAWALEAQWAAPYPRAYVWGESVTYYVLGFGSVFAFLLVFLYLLHSLREKLQEFYFLYMACGLSMEHYRFPFHFKYSTYPNEWLKYHLLFWNKNQQARDFFFLF